MSIHVAYDGELSTKVGHTSPESGCNIWSVILAKMKQSQILPCHEEAQGALLSSHLATIISHPLGRRDMGVTGQKQPIYYSPPPHLVFFLSICIWVMGIPWGLQGKRWFALAFLCTAALAFLGGLPLKYQPKRPFSTSEIWGEQASRGHPGQGPALAVGAK